jgi:hypothetical protein
MGCSFIGKTLPSEGSKMGSIPIHSTFIGGFDLDEARLQIIPKGPFVYRSGHVPFTDERAVRFCYGLQKWNRRSVEWKSGRALRKGTH